MMAESVGRVVAPHAGAWIETTVAHQRDRVGDQSLPMRERGLKPEGSVILLSGQDVAPHAGAWIETIEHGALDG